MWKWIFVGIIAFCLSNYVLIKVEKPVLVITKQESSKNFNPIIYHLLSLGNKRFVSDFLWIYTLIESDVEHYSSKDLNNWMYLRFDTILNLDPEFLEAYQYGAQYLSIIKDDDLGAKDLYERGLHHYPNDYFLNWNGGFHFLYELSNPTKALKLFQKIIYHPRSPPFLPSIIAKLKSNESSKEDALKILEDSIAKVSENNVVLIQKMKTDIIKLKIEIDLICLNQKKLKCNLYKPEGVNYILKNNIYIPDINFAPMKLFYRNNK